MPIARFTVHRGVGERIDVEVPYRAQKSDVDRYEIKVKGVDRIGWVVKRRDGWHAFRSQSTDIEYRPGKPTGIHDTRREAIEEVLYEVARTGTYAGPLSDIIDAAARKEAI